MTFQEIEDRARYLMEKHGLYGWYFTWNQRKRSYGVCNYRKHEIQLSSVLCRDLREDHIVDILLHEIAHALTPGAKHGPVWKAKCRQLGYTPLRTAHYADTPNVVTWGLFYGDRMLKGYTRKPAARAFQKLERMFIPSIGKAETLGKLEIRRLK